MDPIPVSKFKATCLAVLESVRVTGQSVTITKRGEPIAEVVPASATGADRELGSMEGSAEIIGDIVSPVVEPSEWDALR